MDNDLQIQQRKSSIIGPLSFAGITALGFGVRWLVRTLARRQRTHRIARSITILRPRHELYRFLRDLDNLRVIEDEPDRRIAWRIADGPGLEADTTVSLQEADEGRGTAVTVVLHGLPAGAESRLAADLIRLRQLLETGEIATGKRRREPLGARRAPEPPRVHPAVDRKPAGAEGRA